MTSAQAEDPFLAVQREAQQTWASIHQDFERWRTGPSVSHDTSPDALRKRLDALQWDIDDMQDAVRITKASPARFNLSPADVLPRERFVDAMNANVRRVRDALAAGDRGQLLGERAREVQKANESFVDDQTRQQELIMEQQDDDLGHLADAVERIGLMGEGMHNELAEQGVLLDDLGGEMDHTRSRMANVREKLELVMAETGPRQFCTIVWLCITFLVLTVLVVVT